MNRGIVSASANDGLEIIVDHDDEGVVMRLCGHISIDSSPGLRDRLLGVLQEQAPNTLLVVDLTDVAYIDTSGIATLIEGLRIARQGKAILCLRGLQGRVRHLFEVTGLSVLFETTGCRIASPSKVS